MTENQNTEPRTISAEEALRSIASHPSRSAIRVWFPPETIEQGIQLVASRYTRELLPFQVNELASQLVGVCHDLREQEIKAERKAGVKHDVDTILVLHGTSDQVSETYTEEEVEEAMRVVRKRQGQTTIDPHWVRMKLEQELREARAKADNK